MAALHGSNMKITRTVANYTSTAIGTAQNLRTEPVAQPGGGAIPEVIASVFQLQHVRKRVA